MKVIDKKNIGSSLPTTYFLSYGEKPLSIRGGGTIKNTTFKPFKNNPLELEGRNNGARTVKLNGRRRVDCFMEHSNPNIKDNKKEMRNKI